jgi:hypothetical protein
MIRVKFLKENENNDKLQLFSKKKAVIYDLEELKKMQKQKSHNKIRDEFLLKDERISPKFL